MLTQARFIAACRTVLTDPRTNAFAKAYAASGITCCRSEAEMRAQALYMLSNLQHWRGETARETKAVLKEFAQC